MKGTVFGGNHSVFGEEGEIGSAELNLTPLMDVMSNILFFLMASVGASIVALLPASTPTRSESSATEEPPVNQVLLTVQITEAGFKGSASNERLSAADLTSLRFELPKAPGSQGFTGYPFGPLTDRLLAIKEKYKASDTVILLPESNVPYEVIIKTMDAARGVDKGYRASLFPKVVISDLVK